MTRLMLVGLALVITACRHAPTDSDLLDFVESHLTEVDELAAMLQADFDQHQAFEVSVTKVEYLQPGFHSYQARIGKASTIDAQREALYRSKLAAIGVKSIVMYPFSARRFPTFELWRQGFGDNFTLRGVLRAERCPANWNDGVSDEYVFKPVRSGWCAYTWRSW